MVSFFKKSIKIKYLVESSIPSDLSRPIVSPEKQINSVSFSYEANAKQSGNWFENFIMSGIFIFKIPKLPPKYLKSPDPQSF